MLIKAFNKLDEELIKEVRAVESICKEHDRLNGSLFLDPSANFDSEVNCLYALYEGEKLISVLSMFIPTKEEAEVSAYTLPEHRRKGYFNSLLDEAVKELKRYDINSLLFVCEPNSNDGKQATNRLKGELEFTEYRLRYKEPSGNEPIQQEFQLTLHKAEQKDLETIVRLNQDIFDDDYDSAKTFVLKCFEASNRLQYIGLLEEKPIGMVSVYLEKDTAFIYGLGIVPQYQGKGFGKEIVNLIVREMIVSDIKNISIEVDSSNQSAYNLYRKCGFEVEASFDYYRKSVI